MSKLSKGYVALVDDPDYRNDELRHEWRNWCHRLYSARWCIEEANQLLEDEAAEMRNSVIENSERNASRWMTPRQK